jgi:hypothetical protein
VFAEIGTSFRNLEHPSSSAMAAVRLPANTDPAGTTEWLPYEEVVSDGSLRWDEHGQPCAAETFTGPTAVSTSLPFDRRRGDLLNLDAAAPGMAGGRLVPSFLVAEGPAAGARTVYVCSRIRESGMLFTRIWSGDVPAGRDVAWTVREACEREPVLLDKFCDEGGQMTRFDADIEIELKFTLLDDTAPWEIAHRLAVAVQRRGLSGFIPDLGNEMQRWTYEQTTFEVTAPADRVGYVAFMQTHDGTYEVKYKYFAEDSLRRIERCVPGVVLRPEEFADHVLATIPGAEIRPLPHLRRSRFDVNVESASTGHFFGLETDEVQAGGRVLRQLEIEYHRTRDCHGVTAATVEPELLRLSEQVEALLADWGVRAERGYFSKLSFLREIAATEAVDI